MSPEIQSPVWVKNTMRVVALAGLLFVVWTVYSVHADDMALDRIALSGLHYEIGNIDGGGLWLSFDSQLPVAVSIAVATAVRSDDGYSYLWRSFITDPDTVNRPRQRFWIEPPAQLKKYARSIEIRAIVYRHGRQRILAPVAINLEGDPQ